MTKPSKLIIKLTLEDDWYIAECTSIEGCISEGRTIEDALSNIGEAIMVCLESDE